ncbi:hypothetical protein AVEN_196624-1 [Araneus ventricosus]|uniref:Uncharacterized protein n=1 Tax=Araneus ventricosus TaxID=182803 RepID=A0A4Y2E4C2_ARAVE|nr:hypothetical protein AVEN_196624-1 [Araneus ventricosus]
MYKNVNPCSSVIIIHSVIPNYIDKMDEQIRSQENENIVLGKTSLPSRRFLTVVNSPVNQKGWKVRLLTPDGYDGGRLSCFNLSSSDSFLL